MFVVSWVDYQGLLSPSMLISVSCFGDLGHILENMRRWPNLGLLLGQRRYAQH